MIISAASAAQTTAQSAAAHHSIFQDPTFWVAIAFCLTIIVIVKLAGKTISDILQARADGIASKLEEARKLRDEAEALLQEYQKRQDNARQEMDTALNSAKIKAEQLKKNIQTEFDEKLKSKEAAAEARLARAADEATEEVRNLAVSVALKTLEKILSEKLTGEQSNKLVSDALDSLPRLLSKEHTN